LLLCMRRRWLLLFAGAVHARMLLLWLKLLRQ
jgi:hypothetical protein